jgi:hypothetical protein
MAAMCKSRKGCCTFGIVAAISSPRSIAARMGYTSYTPMSPTMFASAYISRLMMSQLNHRAMVFKMSVIDRVHTYDTCIVTKQYSAPFLTKDKFRVAAPLDLCGPIKLTAAAGWRLFLSLMTLLSTCGSHS